MYSVHFPSFDSNNPPSPLPICLIYISQRNCLDWEGLCVNVTDGGRSCLGKKSCGSEASWHQSHCPLKLSPVWTVDLLPSQTIGTAQTVCILKENVTTCRCEGHFYIYIFFLKNMAYISGLSCAPTPRNRPSFTPRTKISVLHVGISCSLASFARC